MRKNHIFSSQPPIPRLRHLCNSIGLIRHKNQFQIQIQSTCSNQYHQEEEEGGGGEDDDEEKISVTDVAHWTRKIHSLCTSQADVDGALRLLDRLRLRGYRPSPLNLGSIVHALCDSRRFSEAHRRLLLSLASPSLPDLRTSNTLLSRLLDANSPRLTLPLLRSMLAAIPHFSPSLANLNRLIHQLCSSGLLFDARLLFDEMPRRGCPPNTVSYTTLINGLCKSGDLDAARHLFDQMRADNVPPNPLTYSVLLSGVLRRRRIEEGKDLMLGLWQRMLAGHQPDPTINNAAFANLIDSLCQEGLFHEVFGIAEEMPQGRSVSEEFAYGQMIDSLCRAGKNHGASRIVYIMRKRGFLPSFGSYNSIIHGLCKEGGCMRAYQLFKEGVEFGYSPLEPTYKVLVGGLCQEFDLCKARDLVEFMLRKEGVDKTRIYNIFLSALCLTDHPSELLNVLVTMLQNKCRPDAVTLNTVIHGFCKSGRVDEATKVLNDMLAGTFCAPDVVTFTTVIGGLLNAGRIEEALDLLHRKMPESDCSPNVITYNAVFRGLCKQKMIDKVMEVFDDMACKGVSGDCTTYTTIIDGLFASNQVYDAKRFWEDIIWPSKVHDDFVYAAVLRGLCNAGKLNEACDFLFELVDCGVPPNIICYNIVIDSACNLGLKREAYQIMAEMRKNGLAPDAVTWRTLDKLHANGIERSGGSSASKGSKEVVVELGRTLKVPDAKVANFHAEKITEEKETDKVPLEETKSIKFSMKCKDDDNVDEDNNGYSDESAKVKIICPQSSGREPLSKIARRVFGLA